MGLSSDFSILDEEECQAILTDLHVANPYQALNAISEEAARTLSERHHRRMDERELLPETIRPRPICPRSVNEKLWTSQVW